MASWELLLKSVFPFLDDLLLIVLQQIEQPFGKFGCNPAESISIETGYDANDLDLDAFTHDIIARELKEVTAHPPA